jgi:hypothetical protein
MHALIDVFLGVMAFCAFVGGIVPFLWFFLPEFRSGFGTSREAQEWGERDRKHGADYEGIYGRDNRHVVP